MRSVLLAVPAELFEFQLALPFFHLYHFGLVRKIVHFLALCAHHLCICLPFCCHIR